MRGPLVSLVMLLLAGGCGPSVDREAAIVAKLSDELPALVKRGEVTGLSVALVRDGELVWEGAYGVRHAPGKQAVHPDTLFEAASLSKPVFAYAVLRLVDRGELDLDRPLADYLAYDRLKHDARYERITARMVLSHQSGLPNWGGTPLELLHEPGERFGYSGEGFVYLQKAVSRLTGLSLEELAGREVFEPLGMRHSSFVWKPEFAEWIAEGHGGNGQPIAKRRNPDDAGNAAASLVTTAGDYALFLCALIHGEGLSPETRREMLEPQVQVAERGTGRPVDKLYWGLGLGLQQGRAGPAFFHWGDNPGYKAYMLGYPDSGTALVYFTNSDHGLSILDALVSSVVDDSNEAIAWLDYERYDAPERAMRGELRRAFLQRGAEAGAAGFEQLRQQHPEVDCEPLVNRLGYDLLREQQSDAAIAVFRLNVSSFPDSSNVYDSLGEAYLTVGRDREAIENYERSLELDETNTNAVKRIRWIREGLVARENPPRLSEGQLRRFVGRYGPFEVTWVENGLQATIEGFRAPARLIPLGPDTFALEGLGIHRLRFVSDDEGRVVKAVGLHVSGEQREAAREAD